MTTSEKKAVKILGVAIGFGNLMTLTSEAWIEYMIESGNPTTGVFVPNLSDEVRFQPRLIKDEIDKLLKEKDHLKINDEFGWSGEWRMSGKDALDLVLDVLKALNAEKSDS
ncbi:MAG: hypothetical protein A2066_00115 [Bacteroidetes bacterium GWB2_41_8]|nr:MAG: hypothetical protein A2066_00115 [Bacteroidetes bacterium GWB2_41_8]